MFWPILTNSWIPCSVNPEHRNVKDSVKKPVFMWTDMPKLRNVGTPKETGITGFSRPFRRAGEHYLRNVKFFMQIERGGYSKALQPTAWCIRLNTNILQGSPANYVGTEPIFVSNVELYRFKHLIINILHTIQLLLGRLGLWVRAPSGFEPLPMTLTNIWKSHIYFIPLLYSVLFKTINNQDIKVHSKP